MPNKPIHYLPDHGDFTNFSLKLNKFSLLVQNNLTLQHRIQVLTEFKGNFMCSACKSCVIIITQSNYDCV